VDGDAKPPAADRAARDRQQAGEYLQIQRLSYSVTATGNLADPAKFPTGSVLSLDRNSVEVAQLRDSIVKPFLNERGSANPQ
jgi:hypothetical protein